MMIRDLESVPWRIHHKGRPREEKVMRKDNELEPDSSHAVSEDIAYPHSLQARPGLHRYSSSPP